MVIRTEVTLNEPAGGQHLLREAPTQGSKYRLLLFERTVSCMFCCYNAKLDAPSRYGLLLELSIIQHSFADEGKSEQPLGWNSIFSCYADSWNLVPVSTIFICYADAWVHEYNIHLQMRRNQIEYWGGTQYPNIQLLCRFLELGASEYNIYLLCRCLGA